MVIADHAGDGWPSLAVMESACRRVRDELPVVEYAGRSLRLLGLHVGRESPHRVVNPHRHSHHELIWILAGSGRSRTAPGGPLGPGTVILHPPQVLHAWENGPAPMLRASLVFTLDRPVPIHPFAAWPLRPALVEEFRLLLTEADSPHAGRVERLRARLVLLLADGLALLDLPDDRRPSRRRVEGLSLAGLVDRFLADNLEQPLGLDDVAVQVRMSVPTLTRQYRRERGCSVMLQLRRLRLREARRLLAARGMTVGEVARRVGFGDCSYFCRCFRRAFGRTPMG
jgi:AraC-like DNA-binding protein